MNCASSPRLRKVDTCSWTIRTHWRCHPQQFEQRTTATPSTTSAAVSTATRTPLAYSLTSHCADTVLWLGCVGVVCCHRLKMGDGGKDDLTRMLHSSVRLHLRQQLPKPGTYDDKKAGKALQKAWSSLRAAANLAARQAANASKRSRNGGRRK